MMPFDKRHRVAFRRVDGDHHLADLAHAGRGRDAARHFARRDAEGAQLGVQRLEFQRDPALRSVSSVMPS